MSKNPTVKAAISAFTEEQVERLTGISRSQLRYWDRTGFFLPAYANEDRRTPYSRIYSFRDAVCLQILNSLRNDAGVSLPHLREVKERLAKYGDDAWAQLTLYVVKKKVVFDDPETDDRVEVVSGQHVLQIPLEVVRAQMSERVVELRRRDPGSVGQISRSRLLSGNKPMVAGTRIPVGAIKAYAEEGYSVEAIQREYPTLTVEDINAALAYGVAA